MTREGDEWRIIIVYFMELYFLISYIYFESVWKQ